MLGYLKIPGFSDYLHPLDATHMLGVGKDTQEVDGAVRIKGVKAQSLESQQSNGVM